ncbi:stage III sporulation protein AE [Clostridium sp. SYSU_GA19001]|uniref:stage III sporulation protein AE n=1 Tax=Clostridium caldaquaticum TaxID=2940653 RepID=UPI002076FAA3|nr:stage III sporulation protein AE [Clostridium caldaquaticum]MCM8711040.1 stage III sporulation protein AE [Clostridium caldaquaticum]
MKKIIIVVLMIILFPLNVQAAQGSGNNIDKDESQQVERLYDYILNMKTEYEVLKDLDAKQFVNEFMKTGDGKFSIKKISNALFIYSFREVAAILKTVSILVIIAIVCALLNNLQKAFSKEELSNIAYFACYAMIIILVTKSFYTAVGVAKDTINRTSDFMSALIPVLMVLLASVGGFTEAAVMDPIIIAAININAKIYVNIIIPIIFMSFVLQFVNNISHEFKIEKLTKLLNQIALWTQGFVMTIFIGIITIRGITSKTIDQVTIKTAKYAVDNFVPIIGKALSDAIATVAGYSLLLKNALSALGLVIILAIVIFPILKILIMSFMYKLTAALIEPISDSKIVNCITSVGNSLTMLMSCVISVSIMFFIMVSIIASAGKMAVGG